MSTTTACALLRTRGAAQFLNVSEFLVRKMAREGELRFIQRTPRSPLLFSPSDLEAWVTKNRREHAAA